MVLAALAVVFFMSVTRVETIDVIGNEYNTRSEILAMVGLSDESSMMDVFRHRVEFLEDISYVSRLEVEKVDLRHVVITVYEKDIIGYVDYMGKYLCVDSHGYIVDYTSEPDPLKPKIRGIDLTAFNINEPIDVSDRIVGSIDAIYRNSVAFQVPVEWIDFAYGQGSRITLSTGNVEIRIGDVSRIEEKFESIKEVLKVLPHEKKGILYVENVDDDIIFRETDE